MSKRNQPQEDWSERELREEHSHRIQNKYANTEPKGRDKVMEENDNWWNERSKWFTENYD